MSAIEKTAVLSDDELYRYALTRRWGPGELGVLWIMLNPSTADATVDDPTIRRCMGFTKTWGYDHLAVVNLYALRATKPIHLLHHPEPVGQMNDSTIRDFVEDGSYELIIAAWGSHLCHDGRDKAVLEEFTPGYFFDCLGTTMSGAPRHPLYVRGDRPSLPYNYDIGSLKGAAS